MGLIDLEIRSDFRTITKVRNDFAHDPGLITFQTNSIQNRCTELRFIDDPLIGLNDPDPSKDVTFRTLEELAAAFRFGTDDPSRVRANVRERFVFSAMMLTTYLGLLTGQGLTPRLPASAENDSAASAATSGSWYIRV